MRSANLKYEDFRKCARGAVNIIRAVVAYFQWTFTSKCLDDHYLPWKIFSDSFPICEVCLIIWMILGVLQCAMVKFTIVMFSTSQLSLFPLQSPTILSLYSPLPKPPLATSAPSPSPSPFSYLPISNSALLLIHVFQIQIQNPEPGHAQGFWSQHDSSKDCDLFRLSFLCGYMEIFIRP